MSSDGTPKHAVKANEGLFKARPFLLFAFGTCVAVFLWPVVFGLGEPSPLSHGLNAFMLLNVLPRLLFLGIAAFFGGVIFVLRRSYIRVTPNEVYYCDGWHKARRIPRSVILSAEVRGPAILVVQCVEKAENFTVPLLAYSRAGQLAALLQRSAMRV